MVSACTSGSGLSPLPHTPTTFQLNVDCENYDFTVNVHFDPEGEPEGELLLWLMARLAQNNLRVVDIEWDLEDPGHCRLILDLIDLHGEVDEDWQP